MSNNLNDLKRFIENKEIRDGDCTFIPATIGTKYIFEHPSHSFSCVMIINEFNHIVFKEVKGVSNKDIGCMYYHADEISEKNIMYRWLLEHYGYNIHLNIISEECEKKENNRLFKAFITFFSFGQRLKFKSY